MNPTLRLLMLIVVSALLLQGCASKPDVGRVVLAPCEQVQVPVGLKTLPPAALTDWQAKWIALSPSLPGAPMN